MNEPKYKPTLCVGADVHKDEIVLRAVDKALQIFGGYGFIKEFPVERMYRDVKGIEFGAGTTQIQKLIIVRELLKEMGGG